MTASRSEAQRRAMSVLEHSLTPAGFLASSSEVDNYRRIWARDGVIAGLAGLASGDSTLVDGMCRTLSTLAEHQGPHGEIPSNVAPESGDVSYGGLVGRVDALLWFLIGLGRYVETTADRQFALEMRVVADRALFLLGCWELNNRGLLYVPEGGDWADEFPISGYNLSDQVLYHLALREYARLYGDVDAVGRCERTGQLILDNYILQPAQETPEGRSLIHPIAYERALEAGGTSGYLAASFSPGGYRRLFDGLGNSLALVADLGSKELRGRIADVIDDIVAPLPLPLVPAFFPPIQPSDPDWERIKSSHRFAFKNEPYAYHNGGLWPMITGFLVCGLVSLGRTRDAERYLDGIDAASALDAGGSEWGFPEFVHGSDGTPGGTHLQTWTAAASVIAERALATGVPIL